MNLRHRSTPGLWGVLLLAPLSSALLGLEGCDQDSDGWTSASGDCDDQNADIHPGALELCDDLDNDCNGAVDDGVCEMQSFSGSFRIDYNPDDVNGIESTDAFDDLEDVAIDYRLEFPIVEVAYEDWSLEYTTVITTGPASIVFTGDETGYLEEVVAPNLNGASFQITIWSYGDGNSYLSFNLVGAASLEYYGFELGIPVELAINSEGYPVLEPFSTASATAMLRRYTTPFAMTDFASGPTTVRYQ